jgi:hypothetical protein
MATALADFILFIHILYAAFVLGGFLALPLGVRCRWGWVRARGFRLPHLVCTAVVAVEALIGLTCPLTWLEHAALVASGAPGDERSFVGRLLYWLLYYDAPAWAFIMAYTALACAAGVLYCAVPPRPSPTAGRPRQPARSAHPPPLRLGRGAGPATD